MTEPTPHACCRWCSADVALVAGRLAPHRQAPAHAIILAMSSVSPGDPCPLSGTVPWRTGRPDDAAVRRHLQAHPSAEIRAAHFQVRSMGIFHGIVVASFQTAAEEGPVQWGFGLPADADGKSSAGILNPPTEGHPRAWAWEFRPFDLCTGEPRPWVDQDDAGATS